MNISSFCLGESFSHQSAEVDCDIECENLLKKHRELSRIQFTPLQHCNALSITLAGPITTVTNARGDILKNNPIKVTFTFMLSAVSHIYLVCLVN
jgi:hypothetical protein